ncbi:MAG: DUF2812 domain-containing protein [Tissierellia bacterium]|nr:DUF2812 domain-containing protein [Tissierellia bacterium]
MGKIDSITKFNFFTISDYEKEEKYLREMANKGYHLESIFFPGFYKFQKGEPKDIVYRLDFNNFKGGEKNSYIKLFEDYGWEYLLEFVGWSYFRKDAKEADIEIFSDDESRLNLVNRIFVARLLPLILIFVGIFLPDTRNMIREPHKYLIGFGFYQLFGLFYILYVVLIIYTGYRLFKLNRKYIKIKD